MNERQFKEFKLNERIDIVNLNDDYVANRSNYNHSINLYTLYSFFVEVRCANFENRITKVQVANIELVDLYYSNKINID